MRGRALVGHLPLDAFGHKLQRVLDVLLEVAVGRAARHRADRAHAAIGLVGAALLQEHFARRLVGAGEQRADHRDVGAGGERLGEIAREYLMPPSAITGMSAFFAASTASMIAVSCGTPTPATMRVVQIEPGPMPTLIGVRAGIDQRLGAFRGRDIAGDDLHARWTAA